jgi:Domain of unknown function (DUF1735)
MIMNYKNLAKKGALVAFSAMVFASCEKVKEVDPIGDSGQTIVKLVKGGDPAIIKDPVSFVNTPYTLTKGVIDIRRDVANNADLNKTMTVVVKDDTAAVRVADPAYIVLPAAWYTLAASDGVTKAGGLGGTFTFTLKPGEFGKQIRITIPDATLLNPSALYALGFTITSVDAGGKIGEAKTVVVEVGAKNDWDGVYAVTGPMTDLVNPALVQWNNQGNIPDPFPLAHGGAWELHLVTIGGSTCLMFDNTIWGDFFHPIWTGTGNSGYGSFALVVNFDKVTNTITSVTNYYGQPAGNTRSGKLDPSGVNAVQGNRDILIKYWLVQTNQATGTGPRTIFDEKWEYIGPR